MGLTNSHRPCRSSTANGCIDLVNQSQLGINKARMMRRDMYRRGTWGTAKGSPNGDGLELVREVVGRRE